MRKKLTFPLMFHNTHLLKMSHYETSDIKSSPYGQLIMGFKKTNKTDLDMQKYIPSIINVSCLLCSPTALNIKHTSACTSRI